MDQYPNLKQILEGALLAAGTPLTIDRMLALFTDDPPSRAEVKSALEGIREDCQDRGFELREVASGYRFQVRTDLADWVGRLWEERPQRYSRALLETLAIIAYRQPLTRGDIEEVRGVGVSTGIIRTLLEREWIQAVGHRDVPGRPTIYATTRKFLDYFGLRGLDELPALAELRDLDEVNIELELDELPSPTPLELKTEPLPADDEDEDEDDDDLDLKAVDATVSNIEENLRRFMHGDEQPEAEDDTVETGPDRSPAPAAVAETESADGSEEPPADEAEPADDRQHQSADEQDEQTEQSADEADPDSAPDIPSDSDDGPVR